LHRGERFMKSKLAFAWLFVALLSVQNAVAQDAKKMLQEAYDLSTHFNTDERAYFLTRLVFVANTISPARDALHWCLELYQLGSGVTLKWDQFAVRKNAALACAEIDPKLSLRLLRGLDTPVPDSDGDSPEDVRTDAAQRGHAAGPGEAGIPGIMEVYYSKYGLGGLNDVRNLARYLGDTGQYPYRGWRGPLKDLYDRGRQRMADEIFAECLRYYRRGSRFKNESDEFLLLLRSAKGRVSEPLYHEARSTFLAFNPKVDLDAPLAPAKAFQARPSSARLNSLLEELIKTFHAGQWDDVQQETTDFLKEGQGEIESTYEGTQAHSFETRKGYHELDSLAEFFGKNEPWFFAEVALLNMPVSEHRDLLRAYLLVDLVKGMAGAPSEQPHNESGGTHITPDLRRSLPK
jgi:hypothetical protein